jgi:hypothetical protein
MRHLRAGSAAQDVGELPVRLREVWSVSSGVQVILAGGASARNVFWQVGTEATLGTGSAFQGTLLADVAITMKTGATLVGRVLAFTGTIALDQNIITLP